MPSWTLTSDEYDIDLCKALSRRLPSAELSCESDAVTVCTKGGGYAQTAKAFAMVLVRDMQHFVLARMVDDLPLTLSEKQEVLTDALCRARAQENTLTLERELENYLRESDTLCLDGFLRFRMQDILLCWELCCEQAATEALMCKEYDELTSALNEYVGRRPARMAELMLCIHADGSCTLTDDSLIRIEYVDCSPDGVVRLLINMAPERLVICDLSGRPKNRLTETLARVFRGRVKVYR